MCPIRLTATRPDPEPLALNHRFHRWSLINVQIWHHWSNHWANHWINHCIRSTRWSSLGLQSLLGGVKGFADATVGASPAECSCSMYVHHICRSICLYRKVYVQMILAYPFFKHPVHVQSIQVPGPNELFHFILRSDFPLLSRAFRGLNTQTAGTRFFLGSFWIFLWICLGIFWLSSRPSLWTSLDPQRRTPFWTAPCHRERSATNRAVVLKPMFGWRCEPEAVTSCAKRSLNFKIIIHESSINHQSLHYTSTWISWFWAAKQKKHNTNLKASPSRNGILGSLAVLKKHQTSVHLSARSSLRCWRRACSLTEISLLVRRRVQKPHYQKKKIVGSCFANVCPIFFFPNSESPWGLQPRLVPVCAGAGPRRRFRKDPEGSAIRCVLVEVPEAGFRRVSEGAGGLQKVPEFWRRWQVQRFRKVWGGSRGFC